MSRVSELCCKRVCDFMFKLTAHVFRIIGLFYTWAPKACVTRFFFYKNKILF